MKDLGQLKILLSAIFCFVGSCALLVSYSVCGHNLFKDLASRTTLLLAGFIGFWLFVLSPVSFIILFPDLFIEAKLINDPKQTANLVRSIHELLESCIVPFVASAVGLGVIIGALSEIKPRKTLLEYVNRSLGLNLRQFSYDFAWDTFLRGIKNHGIITVMLDQKEIKGQLITYSVISEPKQIIMQNCTVTDAKRAQDIPHVLVTELSQVKEIRAENNSLKKHFHELNHCAQTTYFIMAGIGALLLVQSLHSSSLFLANSFDYVTYFYDAASFLFLVLSAIFLFFAARALRHDFSSYRAAIIFYPPLAMLGSAFVLGVLYSALRISMPPKNFLYIVSSMSPAVITPLIIAISYALRFNRKIHHSLQDIIRPQGKGAKSYDYNHIKDVVAQLYLAVDFNSNEPVNGEIVMKSMGRSEEELICFILKAAAEVFKNDRVLSLEQANIIMKWHHILRSDLPLKQRWWWLSPHAGAIGTYGLFSRN